MTRPTQRRRRRRRSRAASADAPSWPAQAGEVAAACHAMAVRFHQGGKLVVFGTGAASTDAQHVAVEFVHPVIVGKRALPAISLTTDVATVTGVAARAGMDGIFAHQIRYWPRPPTSRWASAADGSCPSVLRGLVAAKAARHADHRAGRRGRRRDRRRARRWTTCWSPSRPTRAWSRKCR